MFTQIGFFQGSYVHVYVLYFVEDMGRWMYDGWAYDVQDFDTKDLCGYITKAIWIRLVKQ